MFIGHVSLFFVNCQNNWLLIPDSLYFLGLGFRPDQLSLHKVEVSDVRATILVTHLPDVVREKGVSKKKFSPCQESKIHLVLTK